MFDEEFVKINALSKMLDTYMNLDYFLRWTFVVSPASFSALHFYNRFAPLQYQKNMEYFQRLQWKKQKQR